MTTPSNDRDGIVSAILAAALVASAALVPPSDALASDLSFVEVHRSGVAGVTGLLHASSCAVSPGGTSLYVTANWSEAVTHFARDPASGRLSFVNSYVNGEGGVDALENTMGVAVSPDGANVYTAAQGSDAIAVFSRDPASGALTWLEAHIDGVDGVDGLERTTRLIVSPDGKNVYATAIDDDAIAVFGRNPANGRLTFIEARVRNVDGVGYFDTPVDLVMDSQGEHLYAAAMWSDSVIVFARDTDTGSLSYLDTFSSADLEGCNGVAIAPDGSTVYASSRYTSSLLVLARDADSGLLTHVATHTQGVGEVTHFTSPGGIVMDPKGRFVAVLVKEDNAVSVFRRNPSDGSLAYAGAEVDGVNGVDGLTDPTRGCASLDGTSVYVASWDDDAISVFSTAVFRDGFESGGTDQWSASTQPVVRSYRRASRRVPSGG